MRESHGFYRDLDINFDGLAYLPLMRTHRFLLICVDMMFWATVPQCCSPLLIFRQRPVIVVAWFRWHRRWQWDGPHFLRRP